MKPKDFNTQSPSSFTWVKKGSGIAAPTTTTTAENRQTGKPFSEKGMEQAVTFLWHILKGRKSSLENCDKDAELKWNFKQRS